MIFRIHFRTISLLVFSASFFAANAVWLVQAAYSQGSGPPNIYSCSTPVSAGCGTLPALGCSSAPPSSCGICSWNSCGPDTSTTSACIAGTTYPTCAATFRACYQGMTWYQCSCSTGCWACTVFGCGSVACPWGPTFPAICP